MKPITLLLIISIALTGCALAEAELVDAEANLVAVQTAHTETQSDADTIAALVAELREMGDDQRAIIDKLLADRAADRISQAEMLVGLLDLLEKQTAPTTSPWTVVISLIAVGLGLGLLFRIGGGGVVIVKLPAGGRVTGQLLPPPLGIEMPQRESIDVEVIER